MYIAFKKFPNVYKNILIYLVNAKETKKSLTEIWKENYTQL